MWSTRLKELHLPKISVMRGPFSWMGTTASRVGLAFYKSWDNQFASRKSSYSPILKTDDLLLVEIFTVLYHSYA